MHFAIASTWGPTDPTRKLWACKPCVDTRGLPAASLDKRIKLGGMNEFHAAGKEPDTRLVTF